MYKIGNGISKGHNYVSKIGNNIYKGLNSLS